MQSESSPIFTGFAYSFSELVGINGFFFKKPDSTGISVIISDSPVVVSLLRYRSLLQVEIQDQV